MVWVDASATVAPQVEDEALHALVLHVEHGAPHVAGAVLGVGGEAEIADAARLHAVVGHGRLLDLLAGDDLAEGLIMNTIPTVTKNLLIINVLMFLGTIVAQSYGIDLAQYLGLHFFLAEDFNAAQLITYMFMHAGFAHIFFNMFAVWMFGRILEQVWGPKRFLFYYLVCGIGAGIIQEVVQYIHYETVLSAYDSVNTGMAIIPMEEYLSFTGT